MHYIYRHYDSAGRLLYIGCTGDPRSRYHVHKNKSPWFMDVTRIDVQAIGERKQAHKAEIEAILTEQPIHNRYHKVVPAPKPTRAEYLKKIEMRRKLILKKLESGKTQSSIAEELGVTRQAINQLVRRSKVEASA